MTNQEKLKLLTERLQERLSHLGEVSITFSQATSLTASQFGMTPVNGVDLLIEVNDLQDRYFIAEDQLGVYFNRYWNGV